MTYNHSDFVTLNVTGTAYGLKDKFGNLWGGVATSTEEILEIQGLKTADGQTLEGSIPASRIESFAKRFQLTIKQACVSTSMELPL